MINIAIDGPAGAGKSTIARRIADDLGYIYIDTGAMYRALAYKAISNETDIKTDLNGVLNMLKNTTMDIKYNDGVQHIYIDGNDVTSFIRTPEISLGASSIAAISGVRAWLLDFQRNLAKKTNCIMDGRDIGTSVLPDADVKIFLTASVDARANRRYEELIIKGQTVTYESVVKDIICRDENDSNRECSPLKKSDDAILVDTSNLNFEEVVCEIKKILSQKVGDR